MPLPEGKERDWLYEPMWQNLEKSVPFTGILKELVDEEHRKFDKGEINIIDYEELRKKAKELEKNKQKIKWFCFFTIQTYFA